MALFNAMVCDL